MNELNEDRLYELLPTIYRMRDVEQGEPLKALLRVITEQVNLVEQDINQLYENWFIETCEDWVVPYIGDLVGYEPVHDAGEPSSVETLQGRQRNRILIPRREVANTIRYRRRKGTLSLLELLANDVAGWPARAVEFYTLLSWTQALNHMRLERARTSDMRDGNTLDLIDSPFDQAAHTVDVRRINSSHSRGYYNIPSVGLFVWRLRSYSVTGTAAYCTESEGPHCFTFSVLGNDSPLYMNPVTESDPTHIADEFNLPVPIRMRLFEDHKARLYGADKSMQILVGEKQGDKIVRSPVPADQIIPADLSDWSYIPRRGKVAVDPVLGRIAFASRHWPKNGVWVDYHYGFSADMGGGEYARELPQPSDFKLYRVGQDGDYQAINDALQHWQQQGTEHAIIEITDSNVYVEQLNIAITNGKKSLQICAANRQRPIIRLLDWQTEGPDSMTISGDLGTRFILDGLLVTGRGLQVSGDMAELVIRHSTLVPGWTLDVECEPQRSTEPSLEVFSPNICVKIEHSILGAIQVDPAILVNPEYPDDQPEDPYDDPDTQTDDVNEPDNEDIIPPRCQGQGGEVCLDPIRMCISDSILDATDPELEVLGMPGCPVAHTVLNIVRSTIIGQLHVHAIELGENCIFHGRVTVARRQHGCMRFSYISPDSRTPRRYRCQPDLVVSAVEQSLMQAPYSPSDLELEEARQAEILRVRPRFNSLRYGTPTYCQLARLCADEIKTGADDESEMGVFHDLFQPQRDANLATRLEEYIPAGADAGVIHAS